MTKNTLRIFILSVPVLIILGIYLIEGYAVIVHKEGNQSLPPLFGNFPKNIAYLENQPEKDNFTFAVVGDTHSSDTFEGIIEQWRRKKPDFAVLLGDCVRHGKESDHRFFRAECADELNLPFPIFCIVGNHDISSHDFTISRFRNDYGPTIFTFRYQNCLFIGLQALHDNPVLTEESLLFLKQLPKTELQKYRYRFVFMHVAPRISSDRRVRTFQGQKEFAKLFEELGINYVFAGDYHGYLRVKKGKVEYLVSGGGGAHLYQPLGKQFHHAVLIQVDKNSISEAIIPADKTVDLGKGLKKWAMVIIFPWLKQRIALSIGCNVVLCIVLILILKRLISAFRKQ